MQNLKFTAKTIVGKGRGKDLGFPTINLAVPEDFNLKPGIYACWVKLDNDQGLAFYDIKGKALKNALKKRYMGALHYGPVPVFGETQPSLEIHLLDFNKDIHPANLKITVVKFIRPVQFFDSPEKLIAQISDDVVQTRSILKNKKNNSPIFRPKITPRLSLKASRKKFPPKPLSEKQRQPNPAEKKAPKPLAGQLSRQS